MKRILECVSERSVRDVDELKQCGQQSGRMSLIKPLTDDRIDLLAYCKSQNQTDIRQIQGGPKTDCFDS